MAPSKRVYTTYNALTNSARLALFFTLIQTCGLILYAWARRRLNLVAVTFDVCLQKLNLASLKFNHIFHNIAN